MAIYMADFETTTDESDCRVWAWAYCDIESPDRIEIGNTISSFINEMQNNGGTYYFHNLKFDGNFIIYWLLTNGYVWKENKRTLEPGQFTTLISDMGAWYTINIRMMPTDTGLSNSVEIRDSSKLIPLPAEDIPKTFGLDEHKLTLDYHEYREIGHVLTPKEEEYIKADVIIVAKALKFMRDNGQKKLTSASNALNDFKSRYSPKEYKKLFPKLNPIADRDIRRSYKGGWSFLNKVYKNQWVKDGCVYDVNSMYPWAMKYCLLPYGDPYYFSGNYVPNETYPLYIISVLAEFTLKPGHYPSIQLKHTQWYAENEYIEKSLAPTELTLTSVDYELFLENYDVDIIEYGGGYMFKAKVGMFDEYIDYWYQVKSDSKRDGNKGMEKIAKLMLNSLYGKFGARQEGCSKIPWYDAESNRIRYKKSDPDTRDGGYLPIATFITSYCRDKIIRAANVCGDRFVYADTDSVHIVGNEPVPGMDVDDYRLGAFKLEERFIRARFIRQKTYLEIYQKNGIEKMNLKCCGMPEKMKASITEDDFYEGAIFDASVNPKFVPKLMPQVVPGGVILKETTFQIKKARTQEPLHIELE